MSEQVPERKRPPARRPTEVFKMEWRPAGTDNVRDIFVRFSRDPETDVIREVFLGGGEKDGTDLRAILNDTAVLISIALQYGVPLAALGASLTLTQDHYEGAERPASIIGQVIERLIEEEARRDDR
jgi:hypothetical protein